MKNDDKKDGVRVLTKNLQTGPEKALIKALICYHCSKFANLRPKISHRPIWRPWL